MIVAEHDKVKGPAERRATAKLRDRNPSLSVCAISAPAGVGSEDFERRSTSFVPYKRSSSRIWRLIAPWVTSSSLAAFVILPSRIVASNARRACKGRFAYDKSKPPWRFCSERYINSNNDVSFTHKLKAWLARTSVGKIKLAQGKTLSSGSTGECVIQTHITGRVLCLFSARCSGIILSTIGVYGGGSGTLPIKEEIT